MGNNTFSAWDTIHGREGEVYIEIDGNQELLGNAKKVKIDEERDIQDVPIMGIRHMQHKPGGKNITGEMTLYYTKSSLRSYLLKEIKTGRPPKINMIITNDDRASDIGRQTISVNDIIFEGFTVAQVDGEAEILEEDLTFVVGGYDVVQEFERR